MNGIMRETQVQCLGTSGAGGFGTGRSATTSTDANFAWVAADTVYGVGEVEQVLRRAARGYVLGVTGAHRFQCWGKEKPIAGSAEEIAASRAAADWQHLSVGAGTGPGPRGRTLHEWCYVELADLKAGGFGGS